MTYCDTLSEPLVKKVEIEKKSLDQIAKELCGSTVKRPRQKAIRIIKELLGEDYLIKHAKTLGYNPEKAVRQISTTTESVKRKIVSQTDTEKSQEKTDATASESQAKGACQKQSEKQCDEQEADKQCEQETDSQRDKQEPEQCDKGEPDKCDKPTAVSSDFDELVQEIKNLINQYSLENVKKALAVVERAKI